MTKGIKNVFESWYDDDNDQRRKAVDTDQELTNNFGVPYLTKDIDVQNKTLAFIST